MREGPPPDFSYYCITAPLPLVLETPYGAFDLNAAPIGEGHYVRYRIKATLRKTGETQIIGHTYAEMSWLNEALRVGHKVRGGTFGITIMRMLVRLAADGQRMGTDALPICHLTLRAKKRKAQGYPHHPKSLGEHVKKRRIDLGLLQREVGERIGCSEASVWHWETGRGTPELKWIPAVIQLLGYDPRPDPTGLPERLVHHRQTFGTILALNGRN